MTASMSFGNVGRREGRPSVPAKAQALHFPMLFDDDVEAELESTSPSAPMEQKASEPSPDRAALLIPSAIANPVFAPPPKQLAVPCTAKVDHLMVLTEHLREVQKETSAPPCVQPLYAKEGSATAHDVGKADTTRRAAELRRIPERQASPWHSLDSEKELSTYSSATAGGKSQSHPASPKPRRQSRNSSEEALSRRVSPRSPRLSSTRPTPQSERPARWKEELIEI